MRNKKVEDNELMAGLMSVLRCKGYDGATLNDLARATGLQKASLYHRFPGGKKEITESVLEFVNVWLAANLHDILTNRSLSIEGRLNLVLKNLRSLYDEGSEICLLRSLAMDSGLSHFGEKIKSIMEVWIDGFYQLGIDRGFDKKTSNSNAIDTLVLIQGSLIVVKALNDLQAFQKALRDIKKIYT